MTHGWAYRLGDRVFDGMLGFYDRTLTVVLRHPFFTMMVTLMTIGANIYLYVIVPKGFFPQQDTGRMSGVVAGFAGHLVSRR